MKNKTIKQLHALVKEYKEKQPDENFIEQLNLLTRQINDSDKTNNSYKATKAAADLTSNLLDSFKERSKSDYTPFIKSGLKSLDRLINGFAKGEVIIIGGRPGIGKTALMVQIASNILQKQQRILYFSFDLSEEQLITRFVSCHSGIPACRIDQFSLSEKEHLKLFDATRDVAGFPLYVSIPEYSFSRFVYQLKTEIEKIKPDIIFIDYLQLIGDMGKYNRREQELSLLMRTLKSFARTFGVSIVASSQLSRSVEARGGDKKPILSDLRESGSLEQEADKVLFIWRPEYYNITRFDEDKPLGRIMEVIVAKNRAGITGTATLHHNKYISQIFEFDSEYADKISILPERLRELDDDNEPF